MIKQFIGLGAAEKRTFVRAWLLLLAVDLGLRVTSLAKVHGWLGRGLPPQVAPPEPRALAWMVWRQVDAAARHHLVPMSCLRQSLALQRLLAERGLLVGVYIGARKEQGRLYAHAWIEVEGEAIGEGRGVVESFIPVLHLS